MKQSPNLENVRVTRTYRLQNSVNGNPRFTVLLEDQHGHSDLYTTSSDAAVGYEISNYLNSGERLNVWLTRAGRIAYVRPVTP
jgi:C4-type Zn-finger protein